ncbi:hypothetical protein DI005_20180 [Prauserella sp. PE36]|uniref:hypothetical protein n=1 Tax=Prauserella sp. PE36 TaxID=1504709 RepID=UPI000DE3BE53|nr:hypothetical protein [Prauserella sp. PE36]RBM18113.1 hypothetical protein DI005_20180 [Prauserella sp. PE36]
MSLDTRTTGAPHDDTAAAAPQTASPLQLATPPGVLDPATAWEVHGRRPRPGWWGWAVPGGGRAAHVESAALYQGTSTQVCGLYPFASGSGAAPRGVPIGRHMYTAEPIGLDPGEWMRSGLISNTGIWVQGQPGIGKSTIVKRLATGLSAFGYFLTIPGDVKGEYSALVDALGGRIWRIGRGLHSLNPLDGGPLRAAITHARSTVEQQRLRETLRARQISLLEALIVIVRRAGMTVTERVVLGAAIDAATALAAPAEPVIPDVLRVLEKPTTDLLGAAACDTATEFRRDQRELLNSLRLLINGAIRGLFDRASTVHADLDSPAMSLDLSALEDDDDDVIAAAMLCSWSWSAAMIDSARSSAAQRNVVQIQDELWRALRVAPGLVERSDALTRMNRHKGVVQIQVTHSLDDLEALPTEADRAKARGMAGRNNIMILGGMPASEVDSIGGIVRVSTREAHLVSSWAAPPTWVAGGRHPGRGRYLVKSGQRIGLPVEMTLTATELDLYNTDLAWQERR